MFLVLTITFFKETHYNQQEVRYNCLKGVFRHTVERNLAQGHRDALFLLAKCVEQNASWFEKASPAGWFAAVVREQEENLKLTAEKVSAKAKAKMAERQSLASHLADC